MGLYFWVKDLLSRPATGPLQGLLLFPLTILAWCYGQLQTLRRWAYRRGVLPVTRVPVPVISIGNITAGGTGKTPCVQTVCRILLEAGKKPAILTRGYGGSLQTSWAPASDGQRVLLNVQQAGDEPLLLANSLPGVPVLVGADRRHTARVAVERFGVDVLVLDDGFQHLRLGRDLDLLTMDARSPFGNGHCFPRGLLREPVRALAAADLVLLTHARRVDTARVRSVRNAVLRNHPGCPVLETRHLPLEFWNLANDERLPLERAAGMKVLAFAGIGSPDAFFQECRDLGIQVLQAVPFPDHHDYEDKDLAQLAHWADLMRVEFLLTTEKDAVRLAGKLPTGVPTLALRIELGVDGEDPLEQRILEVCEASAGKSH